MSKRMQSLLVAFFLLATFRVSSAQDPVLLVAHPDFRDAGWRETVLLAAPLPSGGHVGVILNRPTQTTLGELFPDHASSQKVVDPVHFGGPFSTHALIAVVRSRESPGTSALPLARDLFLALDGATIDRVIELAPQAARYYVGLVVWQPGELKLELAKGLWSLHQADAGTVFRKDMEGLWHELSGAACGVRVRW